MKSLFLVAALFIVAAGHLLAQGTSGTSYYYINITGTANVSGTAQINYLDVTNQLDIESGTATFGSLSGNPSNAALLLTYSDGTNGTGSALTSLLARPQAALNWERLNLSGSAVPVMTLNSSDQLILTGTQSSNPGSIIIDPTAGQITVNGHQVVGGSGLNFTSSGYMGVGTSTPAAKWDVEGSGNVILNSGDVGIGANPTTQQSYYGGPAAPLYVANPTDASIELTTTGTTHSVLASSEGIVFGDGPSNHIVAAITGINADYPDYPPTGLYQPNQLAIWSGQSGGILLLARDWPGTAGPIVFAVGDYTYGEVMRMATNGNVGVGGEPDPANLMSIMGNASVGEDYSETGAPQDGMIIEGSVGIGTSTPQAQLDVNGGANFSGPVELQPQGDLSMGSFTAMPSPTPPPGDGDDAAPAGGFRGTSNGAPATSGTGGD